MPTVTIPVSNRNQKQSLVKAMPTATIPAQWNCFYPFFLSFFLKSGCIKQIGLDRYLTMSCLFFSDLFFFHHMEDEIIVRFCLDLF
ncbi:hypothetical protein CICLE_v10010052mg [Citrus x clementina]|uniref:Uncharacterized protein n=1 Tax=Citrus clementina TaxID=85681 RepID=V4URB9_CITCL|nr:hypothetical protein CICLE_v10010052mg [Citrus x clementina]